MSATNTAYQHRSLGYSHELCAEGRVLCQTDPACVACAEYLQSKGYTWWQSTPDDECGEFNDQVKDPGPCKDALELGRSSTFCRAFNACVWEDALPEESLPRQVDCDALTECDWPGMVPDLLGDGQCHDQITGCYNTAICGYDGGDCCPDTCKDQKEEGSSSTRICGRNFGYACRDPNSAYCDSSLQPSTGMTNNGTVCPGKPAPPPPLVCGHSQGLFRLTMSDSFGDGWVNGGLIIREKRISADIVFDGRLESGFERTEYICLYHGIVYESVTSGGVWGTSRWWSISHEEAGLEQVVSNEGAINCDFTTRSVDKFCGGSTNFEYKEREGFVTFEELYPCIQNECAAVLENCRADAQARYCIDESSNSYNYCKTLEPFNALVDCVMHNCVLDSNNATTPARASNTSAETTAVESSPHGDNPYTASQLVLEDRNPTGSAAAMIVIVGTIAAAFFVYRKRSNTRASAQYRKVQTVEQTNLNLDYQYIEMT